ncbi:MAG: signal peptide peptidase SppA [Cyanobacteria bacterium P01_H01_bin.74]
MALSQMTTSRFIAVSLLVLCTASLILGVFNASTLSKSNSKTEKAQANKLTDSQLVVSSLLKQKKDHLQLLKLTGMITMEDSSEGGLLSGDSNAVSVRKALDSAVKDDSVKGVLLRINSPGGTVAMSQELNAAVKRVREKKPVVVSMGDLTASGGYYTACAADYIVANEGTLTASIGVIINSLNLTELLNKKLGIHSVTIKSGRFKDILSPYRKPTKNDLALIQTIIDSSYEDFLATVITGRTRLIEDEADKALRIKKLKAVADGRIVTGRQALASGLVDALGDQEKAHIVLDQLAKKQFKIKNKKRLPLQESNLGFDIASWLGLDAKHNMKAIDTGLPRLPLSARYPNQPLWVIE